MWREMLYSGYGRAVTDTLLRPNCSRNNLDGPLAGFTDAGDCSRWPLHGSETGHWKGYSAPRPRWDGLQWRPENAELPPDLGGIVPAKLSPPKACENLRALRW